MAFSTTPKILNLTEITDAIQKQERKTLLQDSPEADGFIRTAVISSPGGNNAKDLRNTSEPPTGPTTSIALGKALYLLLNANDKAFALVVEPAKKGPLVGRDDARIDSPLAAALRSIEDFIDQAVVDEGHDPQAKANAQTEAMRQIYAPLREKILKRASPNDQPTTAFRLMRHLLLSSPHRSAFVALLQRELSSKDKKAKLGAAIFLEHMMVKDEEDDKKKKKNEKAKDAEKGKKKAAIEEVGKMNDEHGEVRVAGLRCEDTVMLLPLLVECVKVDSTLSATGQKTPTRLTNLASNLTLYISRGFARAATTQLATQQPIDGATGRTNRKTALIMDLDEEEQDRVVQPDTPLWAMGQVVPVLEGLVGELAEWYRGVHPTMETGLREVKELVRHVEIYRERASGIPDKDILMLLCHNWIEFAGALLSSNIELSHAKFRAQVRRVLEEEPTDSFTTHTSCQVITIALLLGHRCAKSPLAKLLGSKKDTEGDNPAESEKKDLIVGLMELVSNIIHSPYHPTSAHPLAFHLLRRLFVVDSSTSSDLESRRDQMRAFVEPLMGMLEEDGAVEEADDNKKKNQGVLTEGVAGLVAGYAKEFPDEILGPVFAMMDSKSGKQRRNALRVVSEVVRLNEEMFSGGEGSEDMQRLRDVLEHHLLARLHDDDIHLRKAAAWLFANLNTARIVPKLASRLTDPDARVRSTAEVGLIETLLRSRWGLDAVVAFLEHIRNFQANPHQQQNPLSRESATPSKKAGDARRSHPGSIILTSDTSGSVPKSPADIVYGGWRSEEVTRSGANETVDTANVQTHTDRLFRIIAKWAERTPPQTWPLLVPTLITKTYASPSDPTLIRFWSTVAPWLAKSEEGMKRVVGQVLVLMEIQGRLTEELLDTKFDDSALAVQSLLFARLCPLLILKTIPSEAFDEVLTLSTEQMLMVGDFWNGQEDSKHDSVELASSDVSERMLIELVRRSDHPVEFPQIRQLSLSLLPKLFFLTSLPLIHRKLVMLVRSRAQDLVILKGWVFAFCSWVLELGQREDAIAAMRETDVQWIARNITEAVLVVMAWKGQEQGGEELHKLQLGAIDSLSIILTVTAPKALTRASSSSTASVPSTTLSRRPLIEEIDTTSTTPATVVKEPSSYLYSSLLTYVLSTLHPPSAIRSSTTLFPMPPSTSPDPQLSIVMANVLVMTIKRLGAQPLGWAGGSDQPKAVVGEEARSMTEKEMDLFERFVEGVGARVVEVVNRVVMQDEEGAIKEAGKKGWGNLAAACLQVLFHIAYTFRADPSRVSGSFYEDMLDTCINSINSANILTQIGSLKLLTTLLSLTSATAVSETSGINTAVTNVLTPSKIARIRDGLEGLQRVGSVAVSKEVGMLVERVLMVLDGGA